MPTLDEVILPPPLEGQLLDPARLFATPGFFEIEIGCGKGGFLLSRARAHPEVRFLGIEWANKFYQYAADRMARRNIPNIRILRADARTIVLRHLMPNCLSALHLYHPDPWPKKRHHKRRLVQQDFADAVARALLPNGLWLIQSDHENYFEHILSVLDPHPAFERVDVADPRAFAGPEFAGTNFEIKYARENRVIRRAAYQKRTARL